jgi:hypothetical protein
MPFAEEYRSKGETANRTSAQYVRWVEGRRVILRILNENARTVWKHWLSEANGGKGMMANCPNTSAQIKVCPIDLEIEELAKDDPYRMERKAKRRYLVNVLERTPITVCGSCNTTTTSRTDCDACGTSLKKNDYVPMNQVKILEGGPQLFVSTLNPVEKMQAEDYDGASITDYDITFNVSGKGRDRKINAIPGEPSVLAESDFLDSETGEPQKLFDLDLLIEPDSIERIEAMLRGATVEELNNLSQPVAAAV